MAIVDSADLIVGYSGGNLVLKRVKSFKPNDALTRKGFIPVGKQRPVGSMVQPGEQTIDLEEVPDTDEEVPWVDLKSSGETFKFTIQYKGAGVLGERWQFNVQVAEVTPVAEGDQGGDYSRSIKLLVIGEGRKLG